MAIQQCVVTSFKKEQWEAIHDFTADTFMIALYTDSASLGPTTTAYTADGEVEASGYDAGGAALTLSVDPVASGTGSYLSFADIAWSAAITARGALIYNASKANRAVCVLDFGADKTSQTTFTIQFPAAGLTSAILRTKGIAA